MPSELYTPKEARLNLLYRIVEVNPRIKVDQQAFDFADESELILNISELFSAAVEPKLSNLAPLILSLRFGLMDGRLRKPEEVGEVIGLSINRVKRIELNALSQMSQYPRRSAINPYLHSG